MGVGGSGMLQLSSRSFRSFRRGRFEDLRSGHFFEAEVLPLLLTLEMFHFIKEDGSSLAEENSFLYPTLLFTCIIPFIYQPISKLFLAI